MWPWPRPIGPWPISYIVLYILVSDYETIISICVYRPDIWTKIKNSLFVTFDLENARSDLKINRLRPWPISYQGTKYRTPGSNHVRKIWETHTHTHKQTHRQTEPIISHFVRGNYKNWDTRGNSTSLLKALQSEKMGDRQTHTHRHTDRRSQ